MFGRVPTQIPVCRSFADALPGHAPQSHARSLVQRGQYSGRGRRSLPSAAGKIPPKMWPRRGHCPGLRHDGEFPGYAVYDLQVRPVEGWHVWQAVSEYAGEDCFADGRVESGTAPDGGVVRSGAADYEGISEEREGHAGDGG